jgi:hypothetical protein
MTDNNIHKLLLWILKNNQRESALLYPNPQDYIFTKPLIDALVDIFHLDKDVIIDYINKLADEAAAKLI